MNVDYLIILTSAFNLICMRFKFIDKTVFAVTVRELQLSKALIDQAISFITQMEQGNGSQKLMEGFEDTNLGRSLLSIQSHLAKIGIAEAERTWLNAGLANFADQLRNKNNNELKDLMNNVLAALIKYVEVNQGAIFIYNDEDNNDQHLEMIACYAYDRKKFVKKRINPGEGLAGQCLLERELIYLKEVPANYINITSGLGAASPRAVLVCPLQVNERIFGILEIASFRELPPVKIDFIKKVSESIAATIKNGRETERVLSLLNSSQQQAEELRAQEEEMRQNMEELQATQEEMQRKSNEIARASAEMASILNGINATMATIEFTPDGTVITANDNFLKTMKYQLDGIRGHHHRKFVPADVIESEDYRMFWSKLANGQSLTGIFKRIASDGKIVWLTAIYNPIVDARGKVVKVVKFANDITVEQEMVAESNGLMKGIDATMATIEFTPNGQIVNANGNFLATVKYRLDQIVGQHHRMFVPEEIINSPDYDDFWKNLSKGQSLKGVFKRVAADKSTIWLNAIYNPILDANGKVKKVVKFASDVTALKQLERS